MPFAFAIHQDSSASDTGDPSSTYVTLPELLAAFGFLFEVEGDGDFSSGYNAPSVPTAFAELRLHNKASDVREVAENVRQFLTNVTLHPSDVKYFKINSMSNTYATKVGKFKGGDTLMLACGFVKQFVQEKTTSKQRQSDFHQSRSSFFFVLNGGKAFKSISFDKKAVQSAATAKSKRGGKSSTAATRTASSTPYANDPLMLEVTSKIEDIEEELKSLDGVPSVSSAIRILREGDPNNDRDPPITLRQVYFAVEQCLQCVSALLKNPKDSRLHRIRAQNPTFQRTLGRFYGSAALMISCGFEQIEGGAIFALKRLGGSLEDQKLAMSIASTAGSTTGPLASFKFPDLDKKTTAFLYRKRADLMQALETISNLIDDAPFSGDADNEAVKTDNKTNTAQATSRAKPSKKDATTGSHRNNRSSAKTSSPLTSELELFLKGRTGVQRAQLAMLKDAFDNFDCNNDGYVDADDLKNYWRNVGEDSSPSRISDFIRERDINNDGRISFEEFAVSYSALLQPETGAWASIEKGGKRKNAVGSASKSKSSATEKGEIHPDDVDDGATPIAAAFGALRLCATIPQCLAAVQTVETLILKIVDVPSAKAYWRIKINDENIHSSLGRFYGGIALIKAFGFNLEENGSVLALSQKSNSDSSSGHSRWERPPQAVLDSLKADLAELKQHVAGLLSPEVSDIAAVSSAVARLRNPRTNEASSASIVVETAVFYMDNIIKSPSDPTLRIINTSNINFQRRVAAFEGGIELLVACGFREDTESGNLIFPRDGDLRYLKARKLELETGLGLLQRFARHEAAVKENLKKKDDIDSKAKKTKQKGKGSPRKGASNSRTRSKSPEKRRGAERNAGPMTTADNNATKKALIEAKLIMEKNVAEIQAASTAKIREAEKRSEQLAKEVQDLHAKLDKTVPRRDASTIQRMRNEDKRSMGKAASSFGLTSNVFKTERDKKSHSMRRSAGTSKSQNSRSTKSRGKGNAVATTTLKSHGESGATKLDVDSTQGFAVGHRIRIGEKKGGNAEERWIVGLGSIIIDSPLSNLHPSGTPIVSLGPPVNILQQKSYERAWLTNFILSDIIQIGIVEPAMMEGEKILHDRKAQKHFERRKVDKHVISCSPRYVDIVSADKITHGSSATHDSSLHASASISAVSSLGRLIATSFQTDQLITFDEGFGFSLLDHVFDSFDTDSKGYINMDDLRTAANANNKYLSMLCSDGNVKSDASLHDLLCSFRLKGEESDRVDWFAFVTFFRQHQSGRSNLDMERLKSFQSQLWAKSLSAQDVDSIVRAFVLYDPSPDALELTFASAVSALLELSQEFDRNLKLDVDRALVESTLESVVGNRHSTISATKFARLYVEIGKLAKSPLLWKKTAKSVLLSIFESFSSDGYVINGEDNLTNFFNELENNVVLSPFLFCATNPMRTLQDDLQQLSEGKENEPVAAFISYNKHVRPIFDFEQPKDIFSRPSTQSSLVNFEHNATSSGSPAVHEVIVHEETSTIYILYLNGIVQTWDANSASPHSLTNSVRAITHEPTPDPSSSEITNKRNESQSEHFKWRQEANLDNANTSESSSSTSPENVDAEYLAAKFATQLLSMSPRCEIMALDEHSRCLLFNTTAGDRCMRFHEPKSCRRTHRVRLSLPNMPYFDHGLFDVGPGGYENANGVTHRVSSSMADETSGAVHRFKYLPHSSVILASVVGSPAILAFCSTTGLHLARLAGHSLPPHVKDGIAITTLITTFNYNGHAASGGIDGDIRVWDVGTELLPALKRRWGPVCASLMGTSTDTSVMHFGDIASFEDSIVKRKNHSSKISRPLYGDPSNLEKFSSLRHIIEKTMPKFSREKVWKHGVITSIIPASAASPSLSVQSEGQQDNFLSRRSDKPFVEVTFSDGSTQFNVPHKSIRNPSEASKRSLRGPDFDGTDPVVVYVEDAGAIVPLMSAVGEKVAVWTSRTRLYDYVVSLFSHEDKAASYDAPVDAFVGTLERLLAKEYNSDGQGGDNYADDFASKNISSAVANMAVEDLQELAGAFDEFNAGFVDIKLFATWASRGALLHQSNLGWRTRMIPSCRVIRKAHEHGVSKLAYLPHSMLMTSGGFNDRLIKFWDPIAHRHRLVKPDCGPMVRWRGESSADGYEALPEEWTDAGSPYAEVCSVDIIDTLKLLGGNEFNNVITNEFGDEIEEDVSTYTKVTPISFAAMTIPNLSESVITVRCDEANCKAAKQMDSENRKSSQQAFLSDPDSFAKGGAKTGYIYCLSNRELFVVESFAGFDEKFVLMDKEALTVQVPLSKPDSYDAADEARKVFNSRTKVRRIAYVSISEDAGGSLREVKAAASEIQALSKSSPTAALLSLGVRAVVFFSDGDDGTQALKDDRIAPSDFEHHQSPDKFSPASIGMRTAPATVVSINNITKTAVVAPESLYYPGAFSEITVPLSRIVECAGEHLDVGAKVKYGVAAAVSLLGNAPDATNGNAEILACEVVTTSKKDPGVVSKRLVTFAVGRTTVSVKACDFDRSNSDANLMVSANVSFEQRFDTSLNRFRALSPRFICMSKNTTKAKNRVVDSAVKELQSAVIDDPEHKSANNHSSLLSTNMLKSAFSSLLAVSSSNYAASAMFEVASALSNKADLLWSASETSELKVSAIIHALGAHMSTSARAYHVLSPLLLSTNGGGMGPLCETWASLVASHGAGAVIKWKDVESFVEASCSRILGTTLSIEDAYHISSSSLLLPRPPFRASPEAFSRNVGALNHSIVYGPPSQLVAVTLGTTSVTAAAATPTLPLVLDADSFAHVMSTMNPMTVSKMQLQKLQEIMKSGFGFKRSSDTTSDDVSLGEEDVSPTSVMQHYSAIIAAEQVEAEIREATEIVANLGHAVRQRAANLLLEGPLLSLKDGKSGGASDAQEIPTYEGGRLEFKRARMHAYSPVPSRSSRGIVGYEGWAWPEAGKSPIDSSGVPITVLDILPSKLEAIQSCDGQPYSAHLLSILNRTSNSKVLCNCKDVAQYYSGVETEIQGREHESGTSGGDDGGLKVGARSAQVLTTSLDDYTPLSGVIRAKGGIGNSSSGVRLARYIGRQILRTLARINRGNFVLRDLSLDSVFLPPVHDQDGTVVIGSLLQLGSLDDDGRLTSEAPDLESSLFSLTSHLCPPEALSIKKLGPNKGFEVEFTDCRTSTQSSDEGNCVKPAVPATRAWDTWCFGAMLFELVTGKKTASYGGNLMSYLARAEQNDSSEPQKLLRRFHYDWIMAIGETKSRTSTAASAASDDDLQDSGSAGQKPGLSLCSSIMSAATPSSTGGSDSPESGNSSLLASAALLASLANGFSYRALLPRSALAEGVSMKGDSQILEAIRQKWIRLEMSQGDRGGSSCCSWPELLEKMTRHAREIERKVKADQKAGDEDISHALSVFRCLDTSGRGGLAPSVFVENLVSGSDGIKGNGLKYPLSHVEASRLASCTTVMVELDSPDDDAEPLVAYEALSSIFSGYPHGGKFGAKENPSSLLLDVLALCFIENPESRPTPERMLSHPFFVLTESEEEAAIDDARAYSSGAAPVNVMVQEKVVLPLLALTKQSVKLTNAQQKLDMAFSVGATDVDSNEHEVMFDVGTFCDVLNAAGDFLHGGGESSVTNSNNEGNRVAQSSKWSPSERHRAADLMFSDELVAGGILPRIVACTLRFVSSDQGSMTGFDFENAAAVGGSSSTTLGQRLMTRIVRFFESILLETRPIVEDGSNLKDGPVASYVGVVLEALVKLYLGEEGGLSPFYGKSNGLKLDYSGFGGSNLGIEDVSLIYGGRKASSQTKWGCFGRDQDGVNHWSTNFMNVIEPVLMLAVTESGEGNHIYPPICDYVRSAKAKIDSVDSAAGGGGDGGAADTDPISSSSREDIEGVGYKPARQFTRTSLYFSELVSLGRTLANLVAASRGEGRMGVRARRSCVSFILTLVRLWGLKDGGAAGAEGLSSRPDALSSMQRAQLLLDVRVASRLLPYVADYDSEIRRDVLTASLAALSTGLPLLGGNSNQMANPHCELALEFCSIGWCEAYAKSLLSGGSSKDDIACRHLASECLEKMAAAGDVACEGWGVAGVVGSLGLALADNRRSASKEGAMRVFENLASSSAPNISKLLNAHSSILNTLSGVGVNMPPPLNLPMLSQRGLDLAKGHTMAEVLGLVSMVRNLISTAAQMDDSVVLGESRPPESLIKLIGQIWGWFEVYWLRAILSGRKDPHENARSNILAECIELFEFLISGGGGKRGTWLLDVAPDSDVCRAGGILGPGESADDVLEDEQEERESQRRGKELTQRLLLDLGIDMEEAGLDGDGGFMEDDSISACSTGLTAFVTKMGKGRRGAFEPFRADKLVDLKIKIMHAVASGMKMGGSAIADKLLNSGAALYYGEALQEGVFLVKNAINSGSEHIHLAMNYADACAARARMWECLLLSNSSKCAEQILLSGACELIVGTMLRDERAVNITNVVIDLHFAPFNGKRLCRNEAIDMLVRCKKGIGEGATVVSKAVVGEIVRQLRKYDTIAQERESLWRMGGGGKTIIAKQVRSEVIRVMRAVLSLRSSELVRDLQFVGGVKTDLLEKEVELWSGLVLGITQKKALAADWVTWAKDQAEQYHDVHCIAAEEEKLFSIDNELRELLGRNGRAGRVMGREKGGEGEGTDKGDAAQVYGDGVRAAVAGSILQSMGAAGSRGGVAASMMQPQTAASNASADNNNSNNSGALPEPILRTASDPAAAGIVEASGAQLMVPSQSVPAPAPQLPPAVPGKRLCTIKVVGPPAMLSLQKLISGVANDVGCNDNEITALSVRRGIQKSGKLEASLVELSVHESVASSIYTRARAGAFLNNTGNELTFVNVEIQSMGMIDSNGNEVFGSIDDDMDFNAIGGGLGNTSNTMSMSSGISNFHHEAPMNTYVENLRSSRSSTAHPYGELSARSSGSSRRKQLREGGGDSFGVASGDDPASLPLLLDRLGGAMSEVRMAFDSRSSGGGVLTRADCLNALLDLRVEPVLARDAVDKLVSKGGGATVDFGSFVMMHAKASGYDGSADEGGNGGISLPGELWVEKGSSGMWICLAGRDVGKLRRGFDNYATRYDADSDKSIAGSDQLRKALKGVGGLEISDREADKYLSSRTAVLGMSSDGPSLMGFQEFCRCWLEHGGVKGGNWDVESRIDADARVADRGYEGESDMYDEYDPNLKKFIDIGSGLEDILRDDEGATGSGEEYANLSRSSNKFLPSSMSSERRATPEPAYRTSSGGAHWAVKQQEKQREARKFRGGERSLLGLGRAEGGDETLRDELRNRALRKGFEELSGGKDRITMGSLRVALARRGGGGDNSDDALRSFIVSRGGSVRDGLSESQFVDAYNDGKGDAVGGSLSLPFVDDGSKFASSSAGVLPSSKAKAETVRDGKETTTTRGGKRYKTDGEDSDSDSGASSRDLKRDGDADELDDLLVDSFTENAIRKTFNMYDLNGDGVISYLELKTVFQQQGRDSSDYEIRSWIRSRDSSGVGSVNYEDFRRNYLMKTQEQRKR